MSQLYRYFSVTDARFAILTNGVDYWFYSDLDEPNRMDQRPFFEFNVLSHRPGDLTELQKFAASNFDVDAILSTASNLKYSSAIKIQLEKEFETPSEEMVRLLAGRVFDGRFTQKIKDDFTPLVAAAFKDAIRELVSRRLTSALEVTRDPRPVVTDDSSDVSAENGEVETTQEEIEAFHIVKAIVRSYVKSDRVFMRDAKSYCAVLIDDNNRKPLARLHFNSKSVKYVTLFDSEKREEKIRIDSLDEIFSFSERLQQCAASYSTSNG